jgi:hypothetical protein
MLNADNCNCSMRSNQLNIYRRNLEVIKMQKLLNFCLEMEFYLKIALSCTIAQQLFFFAVK